MALDGHLGTYLYSEIFYDGSILVIVYRAKTPSGTMKANDDSSNEKMTAPGEIAWDEFAFKSSISAIQDWLQLQ